VIVRFVKMIGTIAGICMGVAFICAIAVGRYSYVRRDAFQKSLFHPIWEKDVVYLMIFPCSPKMRNISPFAIKLETWLRLAKIRYEVWYTTTFSKTTRQIPYIELNGQEYAESNMIISVLKKEFGVETDQHLTSGEIALGHTMVRMMEFHTVVHIFYQRYSLRMQEFYANAVRPNFTRESSFGMWAFRTFVGIGMGRRAKTMGLLRHTSEVRDEMAKTDLKALSDVLDDRPFFLGNAISTVDCALFGHLVQFVYVPMDFNLKSYIYRECLNLVKFVDRVREELWPDWDQMCDEHCMIWRYKHGRAPRQGEVNAVPSREAEDPRMRLLVN